MTLSAQITYCTLPSGLRLYYESWVPRSPAALVVVVHGIGEHSGRYGPLVRYLTASGYGVVLYDQRGHGQSDGVPGHVEHFQDLLSDLAHVIQTTKIAYPGVPLVLLGHSLGGQIALNFVVRYAKGIRALIASSPNIAIKLRIPQWKRWLAAVAHRIVPRYQLPQTIDPALLTHDPDVVARYAADARVIRKISLQSAQQILQNQSIVMALASRIHVPCLFLQAGDDHICDPEATRQFFRRIPVTCKRLQVYDGMYHEILNELDNTRVFADLVQWLDETLQMDERSVGATVASREMPLPGFDRGERWSGEGAQL